MADPTSDDFDACRGDAVASARMARHVARIAAIPWEALCDSVARGCLLEMAYAGGDVSAAVADGTWWVRLGSRLETCAAWAARFHA